MKCCSLFLLPIVALLVVASGLDSKTFLSQLSIANSLLVNEGPTINVLEHYQKITQELELEHEGSEVGDFNKAITEQLPQLYYKKALIEINLNKDTSAIADLKMALKYNGSFATARLKLISMLLERADFDDLEPLLTANDQEITAQVHTCKAGLKSAKKRLDAKDYSGCITELNDHVLNVSPLSLKGLEIHSECSKEMYKNQIEIEGSESANKLIINDLSKLISLQPIMNLNWYGEIADLLLFTECQFDKSRSFIKNCLRIDNDFKICGDKTKFYTKFQDFFKIFEEYSITLGHYYIKFEGGNTNIKEDLTENFNYAYVHQFLFEEPIKVSKLEKRKLPGTIKNNYDYLVHKADEYIKTTGSGLHLRSLKFVKDLDKLACESSIQLNNLKHAKKYCSLVPDEHDFLPKLIPKIDQLIKENRFQEAKAILDHVNPNVKHTKLFIDRLSKVDAHFQRQDQERQREWMNQRRRQQQHQHQQQHQAPSPRKPTKDYYKILDVSRDADEKTIKKAYRTQTLKYHPDKYKGNDLTPDQIENKMQDINQAYEVLSDKELRERYDRGDDPNDSQPRPQANPFGGQNFQFNFGQSGFGGGGGSGFGGFGGGGSGFNFGGFGGGAQKVKIKKNRKTRH